MHDVNQLNILHRTLSNIWYRHINYKCFCTERLLYNNYYKKGGQVSTAVL